VRRGDVRWCVRPDRNPRPYVILTRPEAISDLDKLIAAPITSIVRGLASEVQVGPDDGLRH
jgi:mRNA-degrading endonuclease toxin of MazEF toxin-antitoxin module